MQSSTDIVVVGGGAAGLTVALELQRQGMQTMRDVIVLDAESGPGGSWRRAWDGLPMRMADDLVEPEGLSDFQLGYDRADPDEPVRDVVPRTLAYFEDASNLYIYRPARVVAVTSPRRTNRLHVEYVGPTGTRRTIECRILIDATGHWSSPFVPWVPGMRGFPGVHVPAARLERLGDLEGRRVLVVGGGRTAVDLLRLLEGRAATVAWSTRREPEFREPEPREPSEAREGVGGAADAVARDPGLRAFGDAQRFLARPQEGPAPVPRAGYGHPVNRMWDGGTAGPVRLRSRRAWIMRTAEVAAAIDRGLLRSRGALQRFDGRVASLANGDRLELDSVVWATGSHVPLRHLAPLRLREPLTSYRARSGWNRRDRRVAIVGEGTEVRSADALVHALAIADDAVDALDRLE
ncbi:potassium transporter [Pseudoclavibacter endophyticus]|uniref:FAD-dependent oxidoreductase n=1 Tax=Pseudoclavibacter endophyticus TaxID=1778590 RepID=UPI00166CB5E1|nr:FAD-dependent oxidoreductase [Pseudoclavibacter endophyticus]GGA65610.1 potassium transporter [Pseudoclavibacter endophyticus]